MTGVKHTRGPWEVAYLDDNGQSVAPDLEQDGSFLLDRLDEFASEFQDDDVARQFYGHVSPVMARFRAAIARARGEQSPNHSDQKEVGNG